MGWLDPRLPVPATQLDRGRGTNPSDVREPQSQPPSCVAGDASRVDPHHSCKVRRVCCLSEAAQRSACASASAAPAHKGLHCNRASAPRLSPPSRVRRDPRLPRGVPESVESCHPPRPAHRRPRQALRDRRAATVRA
eukprot:Amastigsp_a339840_147.p3 type:complete len:137 gc:universal Amastigsp_a339840_147:590-180(-)